MYGSRKIHSLKSIPEFEKVISKLTCNDRTMSTDEKTLLLSSALIMLRKYNLDKRNTNFLDFAYYIILKYSTLYSDYTPLYDFSVNFGFYPVAHTIKKLYPDIFSRIDSEIIDYSIEKNYKINEVIETLEQNIARNNVLSSTVTEISYVAPTSFGKSSVIVEHMSAHILEYKKIAVIVPTKSLLSQTYRLIRNANFKRKILIHDEMYIDETKFIAVFTQERALRLLHKAELSFDILYIDEAHRLLERDHRSVLLTRLIKLNSTRNPNCKIIYLSPLITDSNNLKLDIEQDIMEQRISHNIKEPDYYEYRLDNGIFKYNRFIDLFYKIGCCKNAFEYIDNYKTSKTFLYLYSPRKIENFAKELYANTQHIELSTEINEVLLNLKKYVHEEFFINKYIDHGILYLHGKMPDNIKEYLEYKFAKVDDIHYLIANRVILEGINLPIDSLFILNTYKLGSKDLTNLIGRVNRLNTIFGEKQNLLKLNPPIHFVNTENYNRIASKMSEKIRSLKKGYTDDEIENPLLLEFDMEQLEKPSKAALKEECEMIIKNENFVLRKVHNDVSRLKQKMLELGMDSLYKLEDSLCSIILKRMDAYRLHSSNEVHIMDIIKIIFIDGLTQYIHDDEYRRLDNDAAISYYKMFLENSRQKSLRENIAIEVKYYEQKKINNNSKLFIGESYGEIPYGQSTGYEKPVYIDLATKSRQELVNIAIIKIKIEEDFVSHKLSMLFQCLLDYSVITLDAYNQLVYGTTSTQKLHLIKMGLTINIVNKLEKDDQLKNIRIDNNNNLYYNEQFSSYKKTVDDFFSFELSKFL
ncbi:DEAD/DEAH box helicase [Anaerocolumna sp. AGMB13020]|uniref:DEAD/DEAH box helicase n=1 Tax=Anaerocolumna sp. AGMB13020 TaxID=3081750 RepID=UPI002953B256|nr:DEAD/DEAH box helicase [Anaerocolumna sp. AGMB13020]WOO35803.1 DEAD/DEAH box helicase [Anaerocolumna sp. AGMB13020]